MFQRPSLAAFLHQLFFYFVTASCSSIHNQQHGLMNKVYFRDMMEQVLFKPSDVQHVFVKIPAIYPTGTYLQVCLFIRPVPYLI